MVHHQKVGEIEKYKRLFGKIDNGGENDD